jgi:hypothetical protein
MAPQIAYRPSVREFLETHPAAEEVRVVARLLELGRVPSGVVSTGDGPGQTFLGLDCGWTLYWHYESPARALLVMYDVTPPG